MLILKHMQLLRNRFWSPKYTFLEVLPLCLSSPIEAIVFPFCSSFNSS
ncbi:hypothetical protein Leryth_021612 [Lithospermum erythrorhizon]|nr:hypothetical protein Leryth_021612 [Lithospermum erythrorhizon]